MEIYTPSQSAHWYTKDATPMHTVIGKNGKERATTVRDAREHNLLPSVTTVQRMLAKPALDAWKIDTAIMAALTLPRLPDEDLQAFAARVVEDMDAQSEKAMETGRRLHAAAEAHIKGMAYDAEELEPFAGPVREYLDAKGFKGIAEKTYADDEFGFAGTVDFTGECFGCYGVVDFKTQGTKPGKKINVYAEWVEQLAAYTILVGQPNAPAYIVVISSTEPGRIERIEYTREQIQAGWYVFVNTLDIFKLRKKL